MYRGVYELTERHGQLLANWIWTSYSYKCNANQSCVLRCVRSGLVVLLLNLSSKQQSNIVTFVKGRSHSARSAANRRSPLGHLLRMKYVIFRSRPPSTAADRAATDGNALKVELFST